MYHPLECVKRYKEFRRQPCFSHDELLVTAAQNLNATHKLDLEWLKRAVLDMQQRELTDRNSIRHRKLKEVTLSEDSIQEELQCDFCHCYTYLSYIGCTCTDKVSCADHSSDVRVLINIDILFLIDFFHSYVIAQTPQKHYTFVIMMNN